MDLEFGRFLGLGERFAKVRLHHFVGDRQARNELLRHFDGQSDQTRLAFPHHLRQGLAQAG